MKIIVQKFGGTSVRDENGRKHALHHIKKSLDAGYKVVTVVSAMGRKGEPYATDTLLSLVNQEESHISNREQDLLLSCGELISAIVFSNMLNENGIKAAALNGAQAGFITNDDFTNAKI
ncbi:amino acid kinase family protein, partial [Bacillus sp. B-TM1]